MNNDPERESTPEGVFVDFDDYVTTPQAANLCPCCGGNLPSAA